MDKKRNKKLVETIEKAQTIRGISDEELADRAGISRTTLWGLKNGNTRKPRQVTLEAIARTLALDVEQDAELRRREQQAWEAVVRGVEIDMSRIERGLGSPGLALHNVMLALTALGPYELVGDEEYGFGLGSARTDKE